jgi:endogenous inhibitor of DNA gyrase (YacG/DUF329 family)
MWRSDNTYRPFCSERCRNIDLGAWVQAEYSIPGDPIEHDTASTKVMSDRDQD